MQVVHGLPRADATDESSLAIGQIRVLGPPVAEDRVALLMDQDEGQLNQLGRLCLVVDLVIVLLTEEIDCFRPDADQ